MNHGMPMVTCITNFNSPSQRGGRGGTYNVHVTTAASDTKFPTTIITYSEIILLHLADKEEIVHLFSGEMLYQLAEEFIASPLCTVEITIRWKLLLHNVLRYDVMYLMHSIINY